MLFSTFCRKWIFFPLPIRNGHLRPKVEYYCIYQKYSDSRSLSKISANTSQITEQSGPEVIKNQAQGCIELFFILLINVKLPTIVGISTFMSRKNSILGLSEPENDFLDIFMFMSI